MLPVLALYHLYGVKIGVRALAGVCLGPLTQELVVPGGVMWRKKSCHVFKAPFVRCLSMLNDWHISCHFPLLFVTVELGSK